MPDQSAAAEDELSPMFRVFIGPLLVPAISHPHTWEQFSPQIPFASAFEDPRMVEPGRAPVYHMVAGVSAHLGSPDLRGPQVFKRHRDAAQKSHLQSITELHPFPFQRTVV
jgi:hypothetical protein